MSLHENKENNILSLEQKAKELGFWALPPTIDEFISEIGLSNSIYPFWKEHLRKIFINNLEVSNNYILLTGAIGTGKSTVSKISALYTLAKLLMLKDLSKFHLTITKPIQFLFFHVKIEKSRAEFVEYMEEMVNTNKFFVNLIKRRKAKGLPPMPFQFVADGVRSNSSIGGDVIFYVFSEANFVSQEVISFKIDQAYKRFKSRFLAAMPYIGNIIIDTSASFEGAISDILADKDDFYVVRASQWDVKPFLYFKKGYFLVYTGSLDQPARILKDDEDLTGLEPDKIIKVPKELEREFNSNLHTALLDLAGLNIRSPNAIFSQEQISSIMTIENYVPDTDNVNNVINHAETIAKRINLDLLYYIHIDTSLKGDNTGVAMVAWDSPDTLIVPYACGFHNYGDDIPMYLFEEFIKLLIEKGVSIISVSADSYQSYKLLQDITRKYKIETKVVNVESNPSIYFNLKKSILDKNIKIVKNNYLIKELINLIAKFDNNKIKIEHKPDTTKDIADAVACAHYVAMESGKKKITVIPDNFGDILKYYRARMYTKESEFLKYGGDLRMINIIDEISAKLNNNS